eukprot:1161476-Pelagomonas_calceolata.AAC.3
MNNFAGSESTSNINKEWRGCLGLRHRVSLHQEKKKQASGDQEATVLLQAGGPQCVAEMAPGPGGFTII